ncbi:4Fe-4S dicluster domain-containing protein [Blattabacterium cuenoti]|uniref:4Fe-4S dicluster domain-containing protein n=1 Tax=Blattabacterium cuenoti TaxID=1653831 RepID=UPI00163B6852|nr:4Fe-4S dicluster domain-containing protein [Blattabacterium cuenoti]
MKSNKKEKVKNSVKDLFNGKTSRRDFLKWVGFSTASVALSACKGPVIKSIPYIVKPDQINLGNPTYYATTMLDSFDMASVLVKTREGRPIKIEPNSTSEYFNTTSARIQSSLLSLYDEERVKFPLLMGKKSSWKEVDKYIIQYLNKIKKKNKKIVFLSCSLPSYSTKKLVKDFKKVYPNTEWVTYDAISFSKMLDASEEIFNIRAFPFFDISQSDLIISFDSDFLGDWSPENMGKYYAKKRVPTEFMTQHIQIESNMSLSGANADLRISKKPSDIKEILFQVFQNILYEKKPNNEIANKICFLIKNRGSKSVVIADGDKECYQYSLLINKKINSNALSNKFIFSKESNDKIFMNFLKNLENGNIEALFIHNTNPLYSLPYHISKKIKKYINKIPLTVSCSMNKNETNKMMKVITPIPHWLECWGDTHPLSNIYTLIQPTIQHIFNTRQIQDSLMIWGNIKEKSFYNYLKKIWEKDIIPKSNVSSFNEALFHGIVKTTTYEKEKKSNNKVKKIQFYNKEKIQKKSFELRLYTKIGMGDGTQYNNPWLQEFPDPITRTTWGNYITISPYDAKKMQLRNWHTGDGCLNGDCVNLIKNKEIIIKDIPVIIQNGQAIGSIGLALGYGQKIGKLSQLCDGKNGYRIYDNFNIIQYNIQLKKVDKIHKFACIQVQNTSLDRDLIRNVDLKIFLEKPKEVWNKEEKIHTYDGMKYIQDIPSFGMEKKRKSGHHFKLSIDLNSCIGCGSCIISCHSENNVPVVGKEEIKKSRDMHWIRVDRYYYTNKSKEKYNSNPKISFQPIICQHCDYAPCETVCPVGATSHGEQGQNMMTYNRCIGTRYCANNCPYKVRRFNWFDYANNKKFNFNMNNSLGKMVLNPDVVVRSRGVMEKCSLCIQRTQYTINVAKKENRTIEDREFETACSISCPTKAITFGDFNDKDSLIYKKSKDKRSYKLLEFLGVRPNIFYQVKVKNTVK